jgi:hypothetical protein
MKTKLLKTAICVTSVPAILSPTGSDIAVGDKVTYTKIIFRNGEHHLVLTDAKQVPSIFFNTEYDHQKMHYPEATPKVFGGAQAFVEQYGNAVWCELCDTYPTGVSILVNDAATKLETIKHYNQPDRYLRAVLKAIQTDYEERPDAYEQKPPFTIPGNTMSRIVL